MEIQKVTPPYVEFKQVAVEDRNATIEAGRLITKNVNMAFIQQIGQRDQVEKVAEEWLEQLKRQCHDRILPETYYPHFKHKFDEWFAGRETPEKGFPIREWAAITAAEAENLISMKCRTVEQVAELTEEGMTFYGMGGRGLRDKARAWLESANKGAERVVALEVENKRLKEMLDSLTAKVNALDEDRPKRGRPPNKDAE